MNDSEIGKNFKQQAQSAQNPNEVMEKNKQDMKVDDNPTLKNKASVEYEVPTPTLEMGGSLGQAVRRNQFEEKQAKLWKEHKQEPSTVKEEKSLDQQFQQKAAKPLSASFFDSLSDEDKAKIEAYKQANPELDKEQQSQKLDYRE